MSEDSIGYHKEQSIKYQRQVITLCEKLLKSRAEVKKLRNVIKKLKDKISTYQTLVQWWAEDEEIN